MVTSERLDSVRGSGPVAGVLEVSEGVASVEAFRNYRPGTGVEFVFDIKSERFLVGVPAAWVRLRVGSPHENLASLLGGDTRHIVGGVFIRDEEGVAHTSEASGHLWQNWTDEIRTRFVQVMSERGCPVVHFPGC